MKKDIENSLFVEVHQEFVKRGWGASIASRVLGCEAHNYSRRVKKVNKGQFVDLKNISTIQELTWIIREIKSLPSHCEVRDFIEEIISLTGVKNSEKAKILQVSNQLLQAWTKKIPKTFNYEFLRKIKNIKDKIENGKKNYQDAKIL